MIEIPTFTDARGTLSVLEWAGNLPFIPGRFYFIRGAPKNARRAGHAHWEESEAVWAISGVFTLLTDEGCVRNEWHLDRPDRLLLIPPAVWHELYDFEPGAICAVLASHRHSLKDYCSDHSQFLRIVGNHSPSNPLP